MTDVAVVQSLNMRDETVALEDILNKGPCIRGMFPASVVPALNRQAMECRMHRTQR